MNLVPLIIQMVHSHEFRDLIINNPLLSDAKEIKILFTPESDSDRVHSAEAKFLIPQDDSWNKVASLLILKRKDSLPESVEATIDSSMDRKYYMRYLAEQQKLRAERKHYMEHLDEQQKLRSKHNLNMLKSDYQSQIIRSLIYATHSCLCLYTQHYREMLIIHFWAIAINSFVYYRKRRTWKKLDTEYFPEDLPFEPPIK